MKDTKSKIIPFNRNGVVYHMDTCQSLVQAAARKKVEFKVLARHSYPGKRLDKNTLGLNSIGYWDTHTP